MMKKYAYVDQHGFCDGVCSLSEESLMHIQKTEPDKNLVEIDDSYFELMQKIPQCFHLEEGTWKRIEDPNVLIKWGHFKGVSPSTVKKDLETIAVHTSELAEKLSEVVSHTSPPLPPRLDRVKTYAFSPVTLANGITVSLAGQEDLDSIETSLVNSKIYHENYLKDAPHLWEKDPDSWFLIFRWGEKVIQYEHIRFVDGKVEFNFIEHVLKERSYWFWRWLEQPIFDQLLALGITQGFSTLRPEAKEYLKNFKSTYDVVSSEVQPNGFVKLVFNLPKDKAYFPKRRTAGKKWLWTSPDGSVVVKETTDFAKARELIDKAWGTANRKTEIFRMFDERVALDNATVLIGTEAPGKDPILPVVYVIRERSATTSSCSDLMPWSSETKHGTIARGVMQWHKDVGYEVWTTFYVPERINQPLGRKRMRMLDAVFSNEISYGKAKWTEVVVDVDVALSRPDSTWKN